jgi:hypothetical protein
MRCTNSQPYFLSQDEKITPFSGISIYMQHIDLSPARMTSVTIRKITQTRLKEAVVRLNRHGYAFSEQNLMRECLRLALKLWRGHRDIAARNKRYNAHPGPFVIVPFRTTEALRCISFARCHHAGISLSRLMDFALSIYLARVMEKWMSEGFSAQSESNLVHWQARYAKRRNRAPFLISYHSSTVENNFSVLKFTEMVEIQPWPEDTPLIITH